MIVYSETKRQFSLDVHDNSIQDKILREMERKLLRKVSPNEFASWRNSMAFMERATRHVPDDAYVGIEYLIPLTSKRVDFILAGQGDDDVDKVVIVELKQWSDVKITTKDAIVKTFVGQAEREVGHPSYQAWTYAALLQDFNETVRDDNIMLFPCAYLHNLDSSIAINDPFYKEHIDRAPVFISKDAEKLSAFLSHHIRYGDKHTIMYRIDQGKIRPSKELADSLASMLRGNAEFLMIDEQKIAFENAIDLAEKGRRDPPKKNVLIVEGGPGTGKSVVAVNLLVELTKRGMTTQYVSKNAAPRAVFEAKLKGSIKKNHISNLFKGSASHTDVQPDTFDALIVDEAHRLEHRSQYSKNGKNQVADLINAAKTTVFFLDEDQRVTFRDIGTKAEIIAQARQLGVEPEFLTLESQFRCSGSDGYLAWIDDVLAIRPTANVTLEGADYDFRVFDSPDELHNVIRSKNVNNKARVVAGYCWNWNSKKDPSAYDIEIGDYRARWNLDKDGSLWLIAENSIEEVGCIHTCQGLELEYVGVIIGPDLIVRDDKVISDPLSRARQDRSIHGFKKMLKETPDQAREKADRIIKNTYRALMTRGLKGCYIYCTDQETREYFKRRIGRVEREKQIGRDLSSATVVELPFDLLSAKGSEGNAVPIYDLKIAAGAFSEFQTPVEMGWTLLPEHYSMQGGLFISQVHGESMNRRIPNGAWCLFKTSPTGARQGKIVLAQHREIEDLETGGHYSIKRYYSEKYQAEVGSELVTTRVELRPESYDDQFRSMFITSSDSEVLVLAEFIGVL